MQTVTVVKNQRAYGILIRLGALHTTYLIGFYVSGIFSISLQFI